MHLLPLITFLAFTAGADPGADPKEPAKPPEIVLGLHEMNFAVTSGNGTDRGGGDPDGSQFRLAGRIMHRNLVRWRETGVLRVELPPGALAGQDKDELLDQFVEAFGRAVESAEIVMTASPVCKGSPSERRRCEETGFPEPVVAANDPKRNRIEVNLPRWSAWLAEHPLYSPQTLQFVSHEFTGLATGVNDETHGFSHQAQLLLEFEQELFVENLDTRIGEIVDVYMSGLSPDFATLKEKLEIILVNSDFAKCVRGEFAQERERLIRARKRGRWRRLIREKRRLWHEEWRTGRKRSAGSRKILATAAVSEDDARWGLEIAELDPCYRVGKNLTDQAEMLDKNYRASVGRIQTAHEMIVDLESELRKNGSEYFSRFGLSILGKMISDLNESAARFQSRLDQLGDPEKALLSACPNRMSQGEQMACFYSQSISLLESYDDLFAERRTAFDSVAREALESVSLEHMWSYAHDLISK